MTSSRQAIEAVFREEHGLVLASLIRYTGDIQLAEDSLQDACALPARIHRCWTLPFLIAQYSLHIV